MCKPSSSPESWLTLALRFVNNTQGELEVIIHPWREPYVLAASDSLEIEQLADPAGYLEASLQSVAEEAIFRLWIFPFDDGTTEVRHIKQSTVATVSRQSTGSAASGARMIGWPGDTARCCRTSPLNGGSRFAVYLDRDSDVGTTEIIREGLPATVWPPLKPVWVSGFSARGLPVLSLFPFGVALTNVSHSCVTLRK